MSRRKPICNAPFANIYIDGKGNVTPCCFNRDDIFGNIFNEEIEKIWNSANAHALRRALIQQQFPKGCYACEKALKSNNYYNSGIFTYSKLNYKKNQIQAIDFELSYWCNLSCIMCNLHTNKYELTENQENEILKKINPLLKNLSKARFYGGEPLLIPIYKNIWKQIVEINPHCIILLQTNGMIINEELRTLANKGNFIFNISLDSLNIEKSSYIRTGSKLELILQNIKQFKKLSKNDISIAVTPITLNWDEIPSIVKFANLNGIQLFFNEMIQPKKLALWTLKTEELIEIKQTYKKHRFIPYSKIRFINYKRFKGFINHIQSLEFEALSRPNYSQEELTKHKQTVYQLIAEKIPQIAQYDKTKMYSKIESILFTQKIEKIIFYIENTSIELLDNKINEILNKE